MRAILVCVLALAVGCGGGGGGTMATAQLSGTVYEIDGQSNDLAGVPVVLKETGEWAWTGADGSFGFDGLEGGTYTLDFMGDGEGALGDGDEFEDGDGDPKVDVPDGGHVECDVALEDGKVKDFATDDEEGHFAMARLFLTDAAEIAGYHVAGGIKIAAVGDSTLFKVCVEGLLGGDVIEIFVHEESIGTATADGDGRACLVLENELPLGAPHLGELAGLRVDVYLSGTDLRLLVGEVPALKDEQDGDDGEDDGDKPDGPGEGEDGDDCECEDGDKPDGSGDGTDGDKPDDGAGEGEGDGTGEECDEPKDGEGGDDAPGEGDESPDDGKEGEDGVV
jgi:hypothetical protein